VTVAAPGWSGAMLLAGATGLVGRQVALQWAGPGTLHLLVRRPMPPPGAPCQVHVVDFSALPRLPAAAAALCCLGTTIKAAGSQAAFRAVDLDAVLAYARAARQAGATRLAVVSSLGADPRSSSFYSRVKGEMEAALSKLGWATLVIARPSLLAGDRAATGQPLRLGERLTLALTAPLSPLIPLAWRPIHAATVARALRLALAQDGPALQVLESAELQRLGKDTGP
jgi:uncharacterized protein YbjT (DUF2867 family)